MTVLIGGQHSVVYFGPRDNPKCQRWWADRGMIHVEDARDNTYDTLSVREFLHRLKAVNDMLGNLGARMRQMTDLPTKMRLVVSSVL